MKDCPSEKLLLALVANEVSEETARSLTAHIRKCDRCQRLLDEYQSTLALLSAEELEQPSQAEWANTLAAAKERAGGKRVLFPVWARGAALAVAVAVVLVALWQAGMFTKREQRGALEIAERERTAPSAVAPGQTGEKAGEEQLAEAKVIESEAGRDQVAEKLTQAEVTEAAGPHDFVQQDAASERLPQEAAPVSPDQDTTPLSLASMEAELGELDDWIVGVGGLRDSDFLLLYLTEEEEAALVEELERSPSI